MKKVQKKDNIHLKGERMSKKMMVYDKNGNALEIDISVKKCFIDKGYSPKDPKELKEVNENGK